MNQPSIAAGAHFYAVEAHRSEDICEIKEGKRCNSVSVCVSVGVAEIFVKLVEKEAIKPFLS